MGHRLKIWATMTSIILLSGMLGFGFSPDALAGHVDDKGKALGCINGVAKNNPHCMTGIDSPCDNITSDGAIDIEELAAKLGISEGEAQTIFALVFVAVDNGNDVIDTEGELAELNRQISPEEC